MTHPHGHLLRYGRGLPGRAPEQRGTMEGGSVTIVIGIDPGGQDTGLVVMDATDRRRPRLLHHETVVRDAAHDDRCLIDLGYLAKVDDVLIGLIDEYLPDLVGIEYVVEPSGHARGRAGHIIKPGGLIITASAAAWMANTAGAYDVPVALVSPGENDQGPHQIFPRPLHDPRGACRQGTRDVRCVQRTCIAKKGAQRHVRAAWTVAHEAVHQNRVLARVGG
jgi:hypothetical protein